VLGKKNVKSENVEDNSIEEHHVSFVQTGINLFDGVFVPAHMQGNINLGPTFVKTNASARSIILEVMPGTTYTIKKDDSDRFRVALNNVYPEAGAKLSRFVKDEHTRADDKDETEYTFTTTENEHYMVICVSMSGEEPEVVVEVGNKSTYQVEKVNISKIIEAPNVKLGKNLFSGAYIKGTLNGAEGITSGNLTTNDGKYSIVKVDNNTAYTISKSSSNRFRVGLCEKYPKLGFNDIRIVKGISNDTADKATITTGANDKYLILYLAFESDPPSFVQVEKGEFATEWETFGYKLQPLAKPFTNASNDSNDITSNWMVSVKSFGVVGDGVTDDTSAIQNALDLNSGKIIVFPEGDYLVTGTLYISSNTTILGVGSAKIVLGDGYTLDGIYWRGANGAYPIITTKENSRNIIVRDIKIEGNRNEFTDQRQFGLAIVDCENSQVDNVTVDYINYFPAEAESANTNALGYNLAILRSKNINVDGGFFSFGGYECIGIEDSENIFLDGTFSGIGWRTSFQVHRGSKNIKLNGLTIIQDHPEADSALTIHGTALKPVDTVKINDSYIKSTTNSRLHRGGIQSVDGHEHNVEINNSTIITSNEAINTASNARDKMVGGWKLRGNDIKSGTFGIRGNFQHGIIKDNIIDAVLTAILGNGSGYIVKDNILKNNKEVILSGLNFVERDNI